VVTIAVVRHSGAPPTLSSTPPTPPPPCGAASTALDAASWVPVAAPTASSIRCARNSCSTSPAWRPGEHLLVIRAADSANNTGVSKVILK